MYRCSVAVVALAVTLAVGQDRPKWEPPPVPDGWRAVASKDGTYQFAAPKQTTRAGARDQARNSGGLRVASHIDYFVLKDGTELAVEAVTLSDAALKAAKVKTPTDLILDAEKADGFAVTGPREVAVGGIKAREYRLTKGAASRRLVLFASRPRIYALDVAATDPAALDGPGANTFLKSFVLVPPEVVKEMARERAAKDELTAKENEAKFGAMWTLDLKKMTPPDAPVAGMVRGKEFRPDRVALEPAAGLVFSQGKGVFPDAKVEIALFLKPGESVEGRAIVVPPAAVAPAGSPHVRLATTPAGKKLPQIEPFVNRYALNLTFGKKGDDGFIPGSIYLCTPDAAKSFIAGRFAVSTK